MSGTMWAPYEGAQVRELAVAVEAAVEDIRDGYEAAPVKLYEHRPPDADDVDVDMLTTNALDWLGEYVEHSCEDLQWDEGTATLNVAAVSDDTRAALRAALAAAVREGLVLDNAGWPQTGRVLHVFEDGRVEEVSK